MKYHGMTDQIPDPATVVRSEDLTTVGPRPSRPSVEMVERLGVALLEPSSSRSY